MRLTSFLETWVRNYHSRLHKIPQKGQISFTLWRQPEIMQELNLFNCAIKYRRLALDEEVVRLCLVNLPPRKEPCY
jgi:hypothetical protein